MPIRGVVGHEVEPDTDALAARLRNQAVEVAERPVVPMDIEVVGDVVSPVDVRARMNRAQPDRVDAEPRQMVELRRDAGEVAGAVPVRVRERADVGLVDDQMRQVSPEPTSVCRSSIPLAVSTCLCSSSS